MTTRQLLLLVVLLTILISRHRNHPTPFRASYSCNPRMNITLLRDPAAFRNLFLMDVTVFLERIAAPMIIDIALPRNYLIMNISRLRRCQINDIERLMRFILWTRRVPVAILSWIFNQSLATTYKDVHHCGLCMMQILGPIYITSIIPNSPEYYEKIGFRYFPRALLAADVIKCAMNRPDVEDNDYYDGRNHQYSFGFFLAVDKEGCCRNYNGHLPGSYSDWDHWYSSDLCRYRGLHFAPGDGLLLDGIFAKTEPELFITPICKVNRPLTEEELRYNDTQAADRSIIEHYNGRIKLYCPILNHYTFHRDSINYMVTACLVLTNIRIMYQDPLIYNPFLI